MHMAKQRIDWLDIAKGIAIILVIVGHTVANPSPLRTIIFSFHMPLFFILAGYTFRIKPWKEVLSSSLKRLLIPFLLLVLAWRIPQLLSNTPSLSGKTILDELGALVYASGTVVEPFGFDAIGMSWFLVALFVSRLILNGLMMLFERFDCPLWAQELICAAIAVLGLSCSEAFGFYLPLDFDMCCYTVLLMWFGCIAHQRGVTPSIGKWYVALAAACVWIGCMQCSTLELAARKLDNPVFATLGALAGTYVTCWLSRALEKGADVPVVGVLERFMVFCGKNSMAIFCIHAIDWMIPWQTLSALAAMAHAHGIAAAVRCFCDIALAYVIKKA